MSEIKIDVKKLNELNNELIELREKFEVLEKFKRLLLDELLKEFNDNPYFKYELKVKLTKYGFDLIKL